MSILKLSRGYWGAGALAALAGLFLAAQPGQAVKVGDGTVYFTSVPRLVNTTAYNRMINFRSNLYFTIAVPANAGEPLQRVDVDLGDLGPEYYPDLGRTEVVNAEGSERRYALDKVVITGDRFQPSVSVRLAEPVEPGNTVVVGLPIYLASRIGGTQLFGITAFPPGEKAHGQFLGYGHIRIDDN
ncbi:DUF2808 domain-containing protein [Gloeobacter morelensis]|uniref:DUF2808 domain-containing protein n=1 Tax=Gloeobacter morelensis MG652769 TaxID=2781736 RepID=A0ABY3PRF8_9CYAN|nr:DUF2808 domain-containing protein [Gloeobacter morelensis]UFP96296.1 DUF2808 domain-containing protein [Gloeobacter morelensis MG652769]